jgi:phosphoglycolate phosphatase-like HAD superfamily hydrolase
MVGDHVLDILAGKGVGMRTIGVLTGYIKKNEFEEAGADCILNNVVEIGHFMEVKR